MSICVLFKTILWGSYGTICVLYKTILWGSYETICCLIQDHAIGESELLRLTRTNSLYNESVVPFAARCIDMLRLSSVPSLA